MGRRSTINSLPVKARLELERLIEDELLTADECWRALAKQGHAISQSAIQRYRKKLRHGGALKRVAGMPLEHAVLELLQGDPIVLKLVGDILRMHTRQSALIDRLHREIRKPLRKSLNNKFAAAEIARQQ